MRHVHRVAPGQHAAHERRQRVPLVLGERAQDAVEHLETGRLEPPRDTTAGRRQGHRGGAAVDARPAPHQAVLFEAVDETDRARLTEPEHLREPIDRGSVEELVEGRQCRRRALRAPRSICHRLRHPVGDGEGQGPEQVGGLVGRSRGHVTGRSRG